MQKEAGQARQVEVDVRALCAGELALRLNQVPMMQLQCFTGFLARRSRHGISLVFHIIEFAPLEKE